MAEQRGIRKYVQSPTPPAEWSPAGGGSVYEQPRPQGLLSI